MGIIGIHGKRYFSVTQSTPTIAYAKQAGVTGKRIFVTDIAGSSDKVGAILDVRQGEETVLFSIQLTQLAATSSPLAFSHTFESPIIGETGTPIWVTVDGTVACKANVSGFIA